MNIIIPQNIYTTFFALSLPDEEKEKVIIRESSLIVKELEQSKESVGIIPSLDLLRHPDIFVSRKFALSFDGALSNSYFYFMPEQNKLNKILLHGDISANDLILCKILFPEQYGIEPELVLDNNPLDFTTNNYLISGLENDIFPVTNNGISFSDHIAEVLDLPYVNFVLASYGNENLKAFEEIITNISKIITSNLHDYLSKLRLNRKLSDFITENSESVYFDFTANEQQALDELLKLPYYHGIIDDIVEVKFV